MATPAPFSSRFPSDIRYNHFATRMAVFRGPPPAYKDIPPDKSVRQTTIGRLCEINSTSEPLI